MLCHYERNDLRILPVADRELVILMFDCCLYEFIALLQNHKMNHFWKYFGKTELSMTLTCKTCRENALWQTCRHAHYEQPTTMLDWHDHKGLQQNRDRQKKPKQCTHWVHRPWEEVGVLTQHIGHHEGGQLGVGIGVEQAVVRQGMEGVTWLVLHEVQQRWVSVVWGCDGRNLIVFIPCSSSSSSTTTTAASTLTGVTL